MMNKTLYVFMCSMLPIIELRGSIIMGAGFGVSWYVNYLVSIIGNLLPIPFILIFIRDILNWMKTKKKLSKIADFLERKADKHSDRVKRYARFGLFLFVAIPIPGTGAWTGSLIAALMRMRIRESLVSIVLGVLVAGVIMVCASYGFVSFLNIFA